MRQVIVLFWCVLITSSWLHGQVWRAAGGGVSYIVHDLHVDTAQQKIYMCGWFKEAGGMTVNETCIWNGTNFEPIGQGLGANDWCSGSNNCSDLQHITTRGNEVFVGGTLVYPDSVNYLRTALNWYNGTVWDSCGLPQNFIKPLNCNGEIFALGWGLEQTYGPPSNNILRYVNGLWEPFGIPFEFWGGGPATMEYFQGSYYVAGNFNNLQSTKEIMRWDGFNWQPLGQGILGDSWVQKIKAYKGLLYVGGEFKTWQGNADDFLMAWDGNAWLPTFPDVYFDTQVLQMEVFDDVLYMRGRHYVYENGSWKGPSWLAKYDGANFCSFGDYVPAFDMAVLNGKVYISTLPEVNGDSLNWFAEYIGGPSDEVCIPQGVPNNLQKPVLIQAKAFPNPATDFVQVAGALQQGGEVQYDLFDLQGRMVRTWSEGFLPAGQFSTRISLEGLPDGMYVLSLRQNNLVENIRIVKSHID